MKTNIIPIYRVLKQYEEDGITFYQLQNTLGRTYNFYTQELIQAMRNKKINVIDLQISKDGRLVKKNVDLKSVCTPYKGLNGDWSLSPMTEIQERTVLFYGLAYIHNMTLEEMEMRSNNLYGAEGIEKAIYNYEGYFSEVMCPFGIQELTSIYSLNNYDWTYDYYLYFNIECRRKIIEIIYELAGVKQENIKAAYKKPTNDTEANEWLQRVGVKDIKIYITEENIDGDMKVAYAIKDCNNIFYNDLWKDLDYCMLALIMEYEIVRDWDWN